MTLSSLFSSSVSSSSSTLSPPPPASPPPVAPAVPRYSKRKRGESPEFTALPVTTTKKKQKTTAGLSTAPTSTSRHLVTPPLLQCPLPSPHASFDTIDPLSCPFTRHPLWQDAGSQWRLVHQHLEVSTLRQEAYACWVRTPNPAEDVAMAGYHARGLQCTRPMVQASVVGDYSQISWDDQVAPAKRVARKGKANAVRVRRAIEVWKEGDEWFLRWEKMQDVRINGERCVRDEDERGDVVIGPLPAFAVIQVESTTIFWFKDANALGYVTEDVKDAWTARDLEAAMAAEEEPQKREDVWKSRWHDIWVESCQRHHPGAVAIAGRYRHIRSTENLWAEETFLGIASVWATLMEQGKPFAFNTEWPYEFVRGVCRDTKGYREEVEAAVNGPADLIIPLILTADEVSPPNSATFDPNKDSNRTRTPTPPPSREPDTTKGKVPIKERGEMAHILLAIARKKADGTISAKIMDSLPRLYSTSRKRGSVDKIINRIGWLGMDNEGHAIELDSPPKIRWEEFEVPVQASALSCGIHAILNAWIYMLGLPPLNAQRRQAIATQDREEEEEAEFIKNALYTINLALAGHMDLYTIQAFLSAYGYCQPEDPNDALLRLSMNDNTTPMTMEILADLLQERRDIERITAPPPDGRKFLVKDIEDVRTKTKCTHTQALDALEAAFEDVELAIKIRIVMQDSGCTVAEATLALKSADGETETAIAMRLS
ncbi:MAG: hypothetical protein Q9220_005504 [cf. Caloplaca sp. 1 TL-2023]